MTTEKKTRIREPKLYVATINGEKHIVRAKSAYGALKFAVSETVTVSPLGVKELSALADYLGKGGEILDATATDEVE